MPTKKRTHQQVEEDLGTPVALGEEVESLEKGRKRAAPAVEREVDLEKLLFGSGSLLSRPVVEEQEGVAVADDQLFMLDGEADEAARSDSDEEEVAEVGEASTSRGVWSDPDDATLSVPLGRAPRNSRLGTNKLAKLRAEEGESSVSGIEYERRLRAQFEKLHPRPAWAALRLSDTDDASAGVDEEEVEFDTEGHKSLTALLRSDAGLVGGKAKGKLKASEIELDRLRNANDAQTATAAVETVQFHPSHRASVLLTASRDRRVRLFQIDGTTNPLLQTLHVPDLPVGNACFHPSGESVWISGNRPYIYAYDLQAGRVVRSSPWRGDGEERDLSNARFQPGGRMVAVGGRNGQVHLLDWGRSGASGGARVGEVRMNAALAGMCWDPAVENQLITLSSHGSVHVWDIRNTDAACNEVYSDTGSYGAQGLEISPNGKLWSVGSDSGIVNIYSRPQSNASGNISPLKGVGNLTTPSTTMRWNHDGQILSISSKAKKDALKFIHFPSMKVFSNWPTSGTPLGHVTSVDFAPASQYAAIANNRGKVLLYSLRHYI